MIKKQKDNMYEFVSHMICEDFELIPESKIQKAKATDGNKSMQKM